MARRLLGPHDMCLDISHTLGTSEKDKCIVALLHAYRYVASLRESSHHALDLGVFNAEF